MLHSSAQLFELTKYGMDPFSTNLGGQAVALNTKYQQVEHDDNETFDRNSFPYVELYGPNWNGNFSPLCRNISTNDGHASAHHARGGGPRQRAHFDMSSKKARYGFCLVFDNVQREDGTTERVRCGEVFLINSQGCGKPGHGNNAQKDDGPNSIFQKLLRDEEVTWKVLKDPEQGKTEVVVVDPKQVAREIAQADEAAIQKRYEETGYIDIEDLKARYGQHKIEENIQRKTNKEMRRNGTFRPTLDIMSEATSKSGKTTKLTEEQAARLAWLDEKAKKGGQTKRPTGRRQ